MIRLLPVLILLTVMTSTPVGANTDPPKNPDSAKGCAICHYRWIDTFFIEGRGSELVPYHSEKVAASEEMCFSCHDGSIMDSRVRLSPDTGHKVDHRPPADMRIPDIFPLDEKGRVQCATCHTAHGVPSGPDDRETIFMRTSNRDSAMCRQCHPGLDGGVEKGNHPMEDLEKPIPRTLASGHGSAGAGKHTAACETCHTAHGSPYPGLLKLNAGDSAICLACHQDKAVFDIDGKRTGNHAVNVKPKTARIPKSVLANGGRLGDGGMITCQTCHKVHQNKTERHLLLIENQKSQFCFTCHPDKQSMSGGRHDLARSAPETKNRQGQTVTQAGVCSACHLPHQPARQLTGKEDFTTQLCNSCHSPGNPAANVSIDENRHPLGVDPLAARYRNQPFAAVDANRKQLKLPLFNAYGIKDNSKGRMTCATCHNPHGAPSNQVEDKGAVRPQLLRLSADDICAQCHRRKFSVADSKHNLQVSAPDTVNIRKQNPSQSGLCGSCHLIHGSGDRVLWGRESSPGVKMVGNIDLCVGCHHDGGIAADKVNKGHNHPLNIAPAEKGIPKHLPLYDTHGSQSPTGMIRCATCHDPHQGSSLRNNAPGAATDKRPPKTHFLRLTTKPSPSLCIDCHAESAGMLNTAHDLTISAPGSVNSLKQTPSESGPCGVCHLAHNSQHDFKLWARDLGQGSHATEQICNGCHSTGGSARQKVPLIASHPTQNVVIIGDDPKGRWDYFPVFNNASVNPVTMGHISCPSCHQVHQWGMETHNAGAGSNQKNNAGGSFLRSKSYKMPCKDCHGPEAIFRYAYFHDPNKRRR